MKKLLLLMLTMIMVLAVNGCSADTQTSSESQESGLTVTDVTGRVVEFEKTPEKVVAVGVGALRLYTYVGDTGDLVGIEAIDQKSSTGKPYVMANPQFLELAVIGQGGPNSTLDPEQILAVEPDVIFTTLATDASAADELQSKTGVPVVALSSGSTGLFDETLYSSLEIIGQIMGTPDKSQEVVDYIKSFETDLNERTEGIDDAAKSTTYVGALGSKGPQGIESTRGEYPPFVAVNAINVVDQTGNTGSLMIDKEQLLQWNPDNIFIDYDGIGKVKADMAENPDYYEALGAFKNGQVYNILPYILYGTNIEVAIADSYYIGSVLYPEQFSDVDPAAIMDEISVKLLGSPIYEQMSSDYGTFAKMSI